MPHFGANHRILASYVASAKTHCCVQIATEGIGFSQMVHTFCTVPRKLRGALTSAQFLGQPI
jgi:hypothetical protein